MNNDTYHHMVDTLSARGHNALERRGIIALAREGLPAYPTLEQVEHHLQRAAEEWNRREGGD